MTELNGSYANGQRYNMAGQGQGQLLGHTDQAQSYQMHQSVSNSQALPFNFNLGGNVAPGINDLSTSMNALSVTTNTQPTQQSDLNTRANEFVPKTNSIQRPMHPNSNAPQFDFAGMNAKPMYAFGRGQPSSNSPQLPLRRGRMLNSPLQQDPYSHLMVDTASPQSNMSHGQPRRPTLPQLSQQTPSQQDMVQESVGGTTYFYNQDEYVSPPARPSYPNYSAYVSMPTHLAHMKHTSEHSGFFVGDEIKSHLLDKQAAMLSEVESADLPAEVDNYYHLTPLQSTSNGAKDHYNYPSTTYRATNKKDGFIYCLHRIHGFKLTNQVMDTIGRWKEMTSPYIVKLRQVFTTKTFGDNSLVFVYDFHPCAASLLSKLLNSPMRGMNSNGYANPYNLDGSARPFSAGKGSRKVIQGQLAESTIWSYAIQLLSALRTIHHSNLSANGLSSRNILILYKDRLRISNVGVLDVIAYDPNIINSQHTVARLQKEDLYSLGLILLALSCNSLLAFRQEHLSQSLDIVANSSYSESLLNLIKRLISVGEMPAKSSPLIDDLLPLIGPRILTELDSQVSRYDFIENELSKSVENGRLFRVQAKLNTILERSDLNSDAQWSETGDRYILKLFRDYIYHQTTETGAPWIDMAHVISALNKLDAGVSEKICLSSSDETAVIVVSYAELKRCFESAFSDLLQANLTSYTH